MISNRFLPNRKFVNVAQRYSKLCVLIYKANGVPIDDVGNILQCDDDKFYSLQPLTAPLNFGLYRWSMEEDLVLLKSVPRMGKVYSEIGKRFIPYRDRGALRKRFQVLQRRVKSVLKVRKSAANKRPKMTTKKVTLGNEHQKMSQGFDNQESMNFGRRREELDAASILSAFSQSASFNTGQSFVQ